MNCCEKCFKDEEIKAIIKSRKTKGTCDFCNAQDVYIYDISESKSDDLKNNFEELIDAYAPYGGLADGYPREKMDFLKNILSSQWNIFNIPSEQIYKFIIELLPQKYKDYPELFDTPVGLINIMNNQYMEQYSMLGSCQWEDFVKEIKEQNRFHIKMIREDVLKEILGASFKQYKKGEILYRARICSDSRGYTICQMGAPPSGKASSGRANPEGISYLYLSDSEDTTLHEVRAGLYDYVTVGKFKLLQDIEVVDLANIDKISPFKDLDCNLIATNLLHLKKIEQEIAKPLRRYDSSLDYLPSQYICDLVKNEGYAGIEYRSTMTEHGINIAIFNENLFTCIDTQVYDIKKLSYEYDPIE